LIWIKQRVVTISFYLVHDRAQRLPGRDQKEKDSGGSPTVPESQSDIVHQRGNLDGVFAAYLILTRQATAGLTIIWKQTGKQTAAAFGYFKLLSFSIIFHGGMKRGSTNE
jgi:hypothetical protein